MTGIDVIGDVHGHAERLEALLDALGYGHHNGAWRHPERTAVFVGDVIDRAAGQQAATLRIVRGMVDAGSAQIVLGNHEFNAVAFATPHPTAPGYCRPHDDKNRGQHAAFLAEFGLGSPLHREVIDWFRTIPLWLDVGDVRVVHACWSRPDIDHLTPLLTEDHCLTDDVVVGGTTKGTTTYQAVENLLKGPEVDLGGVHYLDKGGHRRDRARARWWDPDAETLRDTALIPGDSPLRNDDGEVIEALPDDPIPDGLVPCYAERIPVLFGHYWFTGTPATLGSTTACVDYSAGNGGPLVAYRWDHGDTEFTNDKFVAR